MRRSFLVIAVALFAGCATPIPPEIRLEPAGNPTLAEARQAPERYLGKAVRWGGTIAGVRNAEQATELEVVAQRLDSFGQPFGEDPSPGRFIARIPGFLEPMVYAPGRRVTVAGTLTGPREGRIDQYRYRYPVVEVSSHRLWPPREPRGAYGPGWYHDPLWYYDPWYPAPAYWRHRPYW